MEELYAEGLATRGGPESCVAFREGRGEALTGVRAGRVPSRERTICSGVYELKVAAHCARSVEFTCR